MNWEGHPTTEYFLIRQKCLKFPVGVGGGRGLPYKSDGDARRKIQIKPLRETKVGVAQT